MITFVKKQIKRLLLKSIANDIACKHDASAPILVCQNVLLNHATCVCGVHHKQLAAFVAGYECHMANTAAIVRKEHQIARACVAQRYQPALGRLVGARWR